MKKIFFALGALASVVTPIVAVVSCGNNPKTNSDNQPQVDQKQDNAKVDLSSIVLPTIPEFDVWSSEAINLFRTDVKNAFDSLTTDGTNAVDVSVFDALTTIEDIKAKFNDLNQHLYSHSTSSHVPMRANAVIPRPDVVSSSALAHYKVTLKNLFANKNASKSLFVESLIPSQGIPMQGLISMGKEIQAKIIAAGETVAMPAEPADASTASATDVSDYRDGLVTAFTGKHLAVRVDVSSIERATTAEGAWNAAQGLLRDYSSAGGDNCHSLDIPDQPQPDAVSEQSLQTFKQSLINQFSRYTDTQGSSQSVNVSGIQNATTAEEAKHAYEAIISHGVYQRPTLTSRNATLPTLPGKDAYSNSVIDKYKADVLAAFKNAGVTDVSKIEAKTTVDDIKDTAEALLEELKK